MTADLDLESLLRAEREGAAGAEDGKDAARARLALALGPLAFGPGAAASGAASSSTTSPTAPAEAAASAPVRAVWGIARYKVGLLLAGGFAIGVATHAALDVAAFRTVAPHEAPSSAPAIAVAAPGPEPAAGLLGASATVATAIPSRSVESLPISPASSVITPAAAPPSAHPEGRDRGNLAAEHVLLETARTALERGDAANAMVALDRHAQRFPAGQLREERESLAVYALVAQSRMDEARARTAAFHRAFPTSLQGPALDALMSASH